MDDLSGRQQRLWEAMESYRSGIDDLSDPQFAALAARLAEDPELAGRLRRLQQADDSIQAAFLADVPVPAGLADRVLQRLAETAQDFTEPAEILAESVPATVADAAAELGTVEPQAVGPERPVPLRKPSAQYSRRRLLIGFIAISTAATLFAVVWIQTHRPRNETPFSVLDEAMAIFDKDSTQSQGKLLSEEDPPPEYPMSHDIDPNVAQSPNLRWRNVKSFLGGPAVAYDLPAIGGRATLYVLQGSPRVNAKGRPTFIIGGRASPCMIKDVSNLASVPPFVPDSTTGGKSAAVWQAGNTLYVLVVDGDAEMYSRCLGHAHGPLT